MLLKEKVKESVDFLDPIITEKPKVAIVLGSGLGDFVDAVENPITIPTADIPHYPVSTVPGHMGQWVIGDIYGVKTLHSRPRSLL